MRDKLLFNICPEGEFFGRNREIDYIFRRATESHKSPNIFLTGRKWMGKTEVLRRVHRKLFWDQAHVVPVYYQFRRYGSVESFSEDYLKEVLKQYFAYKKREPRILKSEVSIDKLERLLIDSDSFELAEFISRHREAKKSGDKTAVLRNAISAPDLITLRSGIPIYLILDDLDLAPYINLFNEGPGIMKEFMEALNSGSFSFLAASSTKKVLEGGVSNGSIEAITLEGLDEELAVSMMMELCRQYNIEFDSEILTLAAFKLEGNPNYIKNLIWAAHRADKELVILKDFVDLYANELVDGNIGFAFRSSIHLKGLSDLRLLSACANAGKAVSEEDLAEKFRISPEEFRKTIDELGTAGLLEASLGSIKWVGDNVVKDYIFYIYETRVKGRSAEEVKTCFIRDGLKEGFNFKGAKIRGRFKEEAAELVKKFNGQSMLKVLFRNQAFSARFKNGPPKSVEKKIDEDLILPQIIGCFDTLRWEANETGAPILIAHGFQNSRYDSGNEVVWIIGVKEATAPFNLGDIENFVRRSIILKENFRATRIVRWVISKEGFTAEAQKRAEGEGIFSTDNVQFRIISDSIDDKAKSERLKSADKIVPVKEFEVVLPSATKAELVGARAVEEIGTEMGFDEDSIGQIKAALVEACINAFEHSKMKSTKVFLRFVASGDRLTIHVQNGGADFDKSAQSESIAETTSGLPHKRGWGLELMKGLMDEVRFEKLRGGTKIVMVKFLIKKGEGRDGQE
ncbi:MAG: ATP-binding protein [Deltaproteobacteria bacterium]|nr:ATP-binding protein [Deltaproteobacteria bacterium]